MGSPAVHAVLAGQPSCSCSTHSSERRAFVYSHLPAQWTEHSQSPRHAVKKPYAVATLACGEDI
eukprot:362584-Chlamydomonas_euryale.AAC.2